MARDPNSVEAAQELSLEQLYALRERKLGEIRLLEEARRRLRAELKRVDEALIQEAIRAVLLHVIGPVRVAEITATLLDRDLPFDEPQLRKAIPLVLPRMHDVQRVDRGTYELIRDAVLRGGC